MPLTEKQISEVKKQILEQSKNLPEEKKREIQQQLDGMSPEDFEELVREQTQNKGPQKGIFRMIIDKEIPSKTIFENQDFVAVLDIKPISKGHVVIIPKRASANTKGLPESSLNFAKEISGKIIDELKSQGTEIQTEFKFGEVIINVIPVYDKPVSLQSERYDASEQELSEVAKKLKETEKKQEKSNGLIKINRRIP